MNYPYSTATSTIPKILEKLRAVGQPQKVDKAWLSSIGFTKDSEQRIIPILKFVGLVEKNGTPTSKWQKFRSTRDGKKVLGTLLISSYKELYDTYPDAHERGKEDLTHFFSTKTTAGNLVLAHTVNTFLNLARFSEFEESLTQSGDQQPTTPLIAAADSEQESTGAFEQRLSTKKDFDRDVTININIQLTLPENADEKVFKNFFEAMKKYLLS